MLVKFIIFKIIKLIIYFLLNYNEILYIKIQCSNAVYIYIYISWWNLCGFIGLFLKFLIRLFSPQKLPFYYIIRQEKVKVLIQIKNIIIKEIKNDIIIISSKGDKKTLSLVVGVYNIWHVILVSIKKQSNISNNNKMNRRYHQ